METRLASKPDGLRNRKVDAGKQFDGVLLRTDEQGPAGGGDEQGEQVSSGLDFPRVCLIMISDNNPALLLALRQLFPDQPREIWVLVHGAGALVDQAALLEFAKRQSTRGDGVTFIKHFVGFPINQHSPIPWRALARRTLGTDACGE